jgi:ketosteroid isomerase-like protein
MTAITTDVMPACVRQYFTAMNAFDGSGMVSAFADDAVVNDVQREFLGHQSIQRWTDREIVGDKVVTTKFTETREHHGDYFVSAEIDGEYDKTGLPDPLVLTFYFSLDDKISRLIILANKPGY